MDRNISLADLKDELTSMDPAGLDPHDANVWVTRDKRQILITQMSTKHLINTLLFIKRGALQEIRYAIKDALVEDGFWEIATPRDLSEAVDYEANAPMQLGSALVPSWYGYIYAPWYVKFEKLAKEAETRGCSEWENAKPNELR